MDKRYFTGVACRQGHLCERYVSSKKCVKCVAARGAKWHTENRDHATASMAAWHHENKDYVKAAHVEYRRENKILIAARRNRFLARANNARYHKEHPEVGRAKTNKRRVLKLSLPHIEHAAPMPIDGRCPHCRIKMGGTWPASSFPTLDHIRPLTKGGHHVPENTMMICLECNLIKGARPMSYLLSRLKERMPDHC